MPLQPWKILESKYLVEHRYMRLRADRCETADGQVVDPYFVQEPGDWVHVVAFDAELRVLVNRQYRHAAGKVSLELPCGAVDPGEPPRNAILRELMEETGCRVERIEALTPLSPNPASHNNLTYPFVAYGTRVVAEQDLDELEEIEFEFMPVPKLMACIRSGEFLQAIHVGTVMLALEHAGLLEIKDVGESL